VAHASLEHYYLIPHEAYDWIKTIYLNVQKQELQVGFLEHVSCRNRKDKLVLKCIPISIGARIRGSSPAHSCVSVPNSEIKRRQGVSAKQHCTPLADAEMRIEYALTTHCNHMQFYRYFQACRWFLMQYEYCSSMSILASIQF